MNILASSLRAYCCRKSDSISKEQTKRQFEKLVTQVPTFSMETESNFVHVCPSEKIKIGKDSTDNLTVILHGEIYENVEAQASYLAENFTRYGLGFAKDIDGSYAILLVNHSKGQVLLITDRVNSRRVFGSRFQDGWYISSQFSDQPWDCFALDLTGIGWYLSSGRVYNYRTLFEGIFVFKRACIYDLTDPSLSYTRYFVPRLSPYSSANRKQIEGELYQRLRDSLNRQLYDGPDLFLSLSAGYDSTGILGMLALDLKIPDVYCFSYGCGDIHPLGDPYLAKQMAESVGYSHEIINSYQRNFVQHILDNAEMGLSRHLSWYCSELDGYKILKQRFSPVENPVLLFGDQCLGSKNLTVRSPLEVITGLQIYRVDVLSWLETIIPKSTYEKFSNGLVEDMNDMINSCPPMRTWFDYKDYLLLDQSLTHWLLPYREVFSGDKAKIRQPFLGKNVLEFVASVPTALRRGKLYYRQMILKKYPQLFKFPRAQYPNLYLDLKYEFRQHQVAIKELINNTSSPLDEIIEPDILLQVLNSLLDGNAISILEEEKSQKVPFFSRIDHKLQNLLKPDFPPPPKTKKRVSPENLLLRLLILRTALRR